MTPYELLVPQVLAAAVIVVIARLAVRRARQDAEDFARTSAARRAEVEREVADIRAETAALRAAATAHALDVRLDLTDDAAVPDLGRVAAEFGPLIEQVDALEAGFGGRGMAVTGFRAEPGEVVLTFTPREGDDAPARIGRVADRINDGYALPPGVTAARALPV